MILQETYDLLRTKYSDHLEKITIEKIQIGLFLTAVKLSNGYCGVASSDLDTTINCCHKQKRDFGDFTPGNINGQKVLDLFNCQDNSKILDRVKHAVLNAVSTEIIATSNYKIIEDKDPFDLIDTSGQKTICIVGAFQSYIRKISNTRHKLYVLELNENALAEAQKQYYIPATNASEILPNSDIVIITGLTLANNTLDDLLSHIPSNKQVIIVGPTSGLIPDILFKHGINIIGSTKITNPERMFTVVSEGGAGFHLFKYCARKICILNE
ncbi:MAG: DUF364 domain-containing protein [Bacteroidales bacterium]|nr:DUF364 domain-containing protein [Bacteroidales bacterium]